MAGRGDGPGVWGVLIPFMMFTRQEHSIEKMTAVWLLPVVAAEVAAACGGSLTTHLASADSQFTVLITSYVLWAYSVPVALSILVILLLRLALHKLPHESMAASSWLALGPIGTGALGMLVMGSDARPSSPPTALHPSVRWQQASVCWSVCCSGGWVCGGWRWPC